jgi:hypothetical protein
MNELDKVAALMEQKEATIGKGGDVDKETESTFNPKAIGKHMDSSEDLPKDMINAMAEKPLNQSLSTSGLSGIVLKPKEFQRIILIHMNHGGLADTLDAGDKVFGPTSEVNDLASINHDSFSPDIFSMLKDFLPLRSVLSPFNGTSRKMTIVVIKKPSIVTDNTMLNKISAAYNGYRKSLYDHFSKEASLAIAQNRAFRNELFKYGSTGSFVDETTLKLLREF